MVSIEKYHGMRWISSSSETLDFDGVISPELYLDFAKRDFREMDGLRSLANAVSNAKRSLHLQSELLSDALGIKSIMPRGQISFPKRIGFLRDCGVVGGTILNKINSIRNTVEHDYIVPDATVVQDFIDVVELFVAASERLIRSFPSMADITYEYCLDGAPAVEVLLFPPGEGQIYLYSHQTDKAAREELRGMDVDEWQRKYSIKLSPQNQEYYDWVKWLIKAHI
jgi:hypothetical protein